MSKTTRIYNRGNVVESPANTYTWAPSQEVVLKTGISSLALVASTDGSNIADITITFLFDNLATYAKNNNFGILIAGDYIVNTSDLNAPVANVITDSLIFLDATSYDAFVSQLVSDISFEVITPDATYE